MRGSALQPEEEAAPILHTLVEVFCAWCTHDNEVSTTTRVAHIPGVEIVANAHLGATSFNVTTLSPCWRGVRVLGLDARFVA